MSPSDLILQINTEVSRYRTDIQRINREVKIILILETNERE